MSRSFAALSVVTLLLTVMPTPTQAITLSMTSPWVYNQPVVIAGDNLDGDHPLYKELCIAPEGFSENKKCYEENDDVKFSVWNDTQISFMPPADAPARGHVTLKLTNDVEKCFGSAGCDDYREYDVEKDIGGYSAAPFVTDIVDMDAGKNVYDLQPATQYKIKGALFGEGKGSIFMTYKNTSKQISPSDIISWAYDTIVFKTPADAAVPVSFSVNNGTTATKYTLLKGYQSSSSSSLSSSASSVRSSEPTATLPTSSPFTDVSSGNGYMSAILWAKQSGILQGYPDGTFKPDNAVNRAEFLKIVLGAKGINVSDVGGTSGFKDVDENGWYAAYVRYAKQQGIIQGYADGTFKPNQTVNFAEALKMAYNALGVTTTDVGGNWYDRFLQHAKTNNVLFTNYVQIDGGMSRKDVVWIAWKLMTHEGDWQQPSKVSTTPPSSPTASVQFKDGTYVVGKDIQAGTYRTRKGASGCYYSRLSGFSGESSDIISNAFTNDISIVTIDASDKGFKSSGCGTWTQDLSAVTTSKTSFGDGTFIIGTDIDAGTYKNSDSSGCYYSRLSGFSGESSDIISNAFTNDISIVTIDASDKAFKSSDCGTWSKM